MLFFAWILSMSLLSFDCKRVSAEESNSQELNKSILEQIDNLDFEALEKYLQSLSMIGEGETIAQRLLAYIQGEEVHYESFLQDLWKIFTIEVRKLLPSFACIAAITLLCGILSSLKSDYLSASTGKTVFMIAYLGCLLPILSILMECISSANGCVSSLREQMQLVFPLLLTLMAASGGAVSVAIYQPAVAFLANSLVGIISYVIFPFTVAILSFNVVSHLFEEMKLAKFSAFFKAINKWIIGIAVSVFALFFTIQGITAAHYDGVAKRVAKYAIGNGVPIVGGFLSGGFDLAVAGSILIKNSLGSLSIFLLVSILIGPLMILIATNLLLRLTAAVAQPFGQNKISDFLGETADTLNFFTAGLLFTAFLYFVVILLIVCSSEAFF